jgi:hypothetical protein
MKKELLILGLVGVLGLAARPSRAQSVELTMDIFTSSVLSQTTTLLNNNAVMSAYRNSEAEKRGTASSKATSRAAGRTVSLTYTPTTTLRQQTVQELGRKLQASNPAAGQSFSNAFGPGKADYSQLFMEMVKQSGLPANNAATAFAAYLEIGYAIVNDVQNESSITPAMDRALQRQATGILSENKGLTSPTAVARFGEATKLQAIVLYLGWQSARQHGQASQFRQNIAQQFRKQGLDLSLLKLTTEGLVKK